MPRSERAQRGSKPDEVRRPGPPPALVVRRFGEPAMAEALASALVATGRVQRATHGFHTWPANLHPDAAAAVLSLQPGPVHDPFCGGGTVLVEALLAGRPASGADLNPIAAMVARARTAGPALASPLRAASRRVAEHSKNTRTTPVPIPESVERWYEPHVAQEIARMKLGIEAEDKAVQPLLLAVLSSILVKVSYRASDTRNVREPEHRPPGTTTVLFHKKARELGRMLDELPAGGQVRVRVGSAVKLGPPDGTALVLTSPPYPGVYDYAPMQQLRYAWLGMEPDDALNGEIGSRRTFRALGRSEGIRVWREDTARWVATQARGLRSGARMAIVVGDGFVGGRLVDALFPTVECMEAAGLQVIARASADRVDHAREVIRIEHLVLAERP